MGNLEFYPKNRNGKSLVCSVGQTQFDSHFVKIVLVAKCRRDCRGTRINLGVEFGSSNYELWGDEDDLGRKVGSGQKINLTETPDA